MDKNPSPVVVINATELRLNQSPLSNYGIDEPYQKIKHYCKQCAHCEKSETGPPRFKTCSLCLSIGVKRWEPLFHFYCSRECQKTHWQKHRIEHQLYEAKKHATPNDCSEDTSSQTAVQSTRVPQGTQCNVKEDRKKSDGKIIYPSEDRWLSLVPHPSGPSRTLRHYIDKEMKDATTDTSDAPKRGKKRAKNESLVPKKEFDDYASFSSDNITVVNVNEYPPLDENYVFNPDGSSSSGSDAGGSNMFIYTDEDGKKSAVLKRRTKKDKKTFNPRVLFEPDMRVRHRRPTSAVPKIKELTADEIDSLAAKCNTKYRANLKDTNRSRAAEVEKLKHDAHVQKDKSVENNAKKVTMRSQPSTESSTPELPNVQRSPNPQLSVSDSVSSNAGNSKRPTKEKKPYTDAEFMIVTKSSTKSLYTGSSTQQMGAISLVQRDGGAVINEIKPPFDSPKSMELLKRKMDEIVTRKFRSQVHTSTDRIENLMLQVLDQYLDVIPAGKVSEKPQGRGCVASKLSPHDEDGFLSPLSDDDYHDACTDFRNDPQAQKPSVESTKSDESEGVTMATDCNIDAGVTKAESGKLVVTETEEERVQRLISHINRMTYEKVKEADDPDDLETFCKNKAVARAEPENVKSEKSMKNDIKHQTHVASVSENSEAQEVATKLFARDSEEKLENLVYVVPPYIHSKYPRRVDQYNGADPNDPFVEYSSSQSFVVQKPSRQRDVSYIGLLLSEKPNTVITQRYILLKNAAYDSRDIELGIKREVIDINEAGEPLYDDYLIRKIDMKKDSETKSSESINDNETDKSMAERQMLTVNNPSNILSQLTSATNLTSSISSNTDACQSVSGTCVDGLNSQPTSTLSGLANESTANNEADDRSESLSEGCSNVEKEQKASDLPVVEDCLASKDDSTSTKLEGIGRFRVRNSSKEFGDIFSAEAEQQMANAPTLDLSKVFGSQSDETRPTADGMHSTDNGLNSPKINSELEPSCSSHTDAFDDPFLIRTAELDSFPYQFRKEQGCIFIIKRWEDYYY